MAALDLEPGPDYVLRGHRDSVNALCFLNESELASGSGDGVVKIWNLGSRRPVVEVTASETSSVLSLSHIQQDHLLISCSRDGVVNVWDTDAVFNSSTPVTSFYCGVGHFCNAATDRSQRDSNTIITPASEESQIIIWDIRMSAGSNSATSRVVTSKAVGCIDTDKGKGMLSSLHYNSCVVRRLQPGSSLNVPSTAREKDSDDDNDDEEEKEPRKEESSATECCSSSSLLLAGFESGAVTSYDLRTGRVLCEYTDDGEPVMALDSFSNCTDSNDTAAPHGFLHPPPDSVTDPDTVIVTDMGAGTSTVAAKPRTASTMVAAGGASNQLRLYRDFKVAKHDLTTSKNEQALIVPLRKPGSGCVRFRPDGRLLVSGHWDHSVRIFSTKKMKPLAIMRHHSASVYAVDFSPAPHLIGNTINSSSGCRSGCFATGSKDCTIAVWSLFADS